MSYYARLVTYFFVYSGLTTVKPVLKLKIADISTTIPSTSHKGVLKFMGRIIGLALADEMPIGIDFAISFCKSLLWKSRREDICLEDLKVDSEKYWCNRTHLAMDLIQENPILHFLFFIAEESEVLAFISGRRWRTVQYSGKHNSEFEHIRNESSTRRDHLCSAKHTSTLKLLISQKKLP